MPPPRIKSFTWRVASGSLTTKENKKKRKLEISDVYSICGSGTENEFHAVVECTNARALCRELREVWHLPSENAFRYTRTDWLQCLLAPCSEEIRLTIMFIFRAWYLRNNVVHEDSEASLSVSKTSHSGM